jgi:hypothetical protein
MNHSNKIAHTKGVQRLPASIYIILSACLLANVAVIAIMLKYFIR